MIATDFEIVAKRRSNPVGLVDVKDFELRECGQIDAWEILANQRISFYAFDFENNRAVFVETDSSEKLLQAPFYYQAQYENAMRVLTIPIETMIGLAQSVPLDDSKLIFIQSTGRCGSTLASKILAQQPGVMSISEPDALTQLVVVRFMQPDQKEMVSQLLDASMRLLCKIPAPAAWAIKGRSWVIELGDLLQELYPRARSVYLYRDAESWIKSNLSAFLIDVERTPEEMYQLEVETRGWMKFVVPSIARYDPNKHLTLTELLSLMWLDNMERYTSLHQAGIRMLAIPYTNWKLDRRRTALSLMEYYGFHPDDLSALDETLSKDSQEGSVVSQDTLKQRAITIQAFDQTQMYRHLQNHPYIKSPNFEAANSLKL